MIVDKILLSKNTHQNGMALVLVLWVLTLLTIMAGSFTLSMRREASVISSIRDTAEATAIAEAGIALAETMLLNEDEEQRWKTDGTIYQLGFAEAAIRIQVFNERGKIDINVSEQAQLKRLFEFVEIEAQQQSELVGAILDWRDQNDLVRINGAEGGQYEDEGLKYVPRNEAFRSIDELQLILGMNEEIFKQIEPLITIYSKQKRIDKKSASAEVLNAFFFDDVDVQSDTDANKSEINDINLISDDLEESDREAQKAIIEADETEADEQFATSAQGNGVYTVIAEARLSQGAKSMIKVIIRQTGIAQLKQPFEILQWTRMQINDDSLF